MSARALAARRARTKKRAARALGMTFLFIIALLMALPTVMVTAVGLVPSLVALIVDLTPGRYAFRCVLALNFAGVAPSLYRLWTGANNMEQAIGIISDVYAWLSFYGAAGLGWLLFLGLPGVVSVIMAFNATRKISALKDRQAELIAEWGPALRAAGQTAAAADDDEDEEAPEEEAEDPREAA